MSAAQFDPVVERSDRLDALVLPGETVATLVLPPPELSAGAGAAGLNRALQNIRLGPGLQQQGDRIVASAGGTFRKTADRKYFVDKWPRRVRLSSACCPSRTRARRCAQLTLMGRCSMCRACMIASSAL